MIFALLSGFLLLKKIAVHSPSVPSVFKSDCCSDNYCDDNAECEWDGGDCCQKEMLK